ncbi:MAG: glycosyl transferase family protein [Pseudomonadota bacterium]
MSFSRFVHAMGRGPGRARSLTQAEAQEAMSLMLQDKAPPEAVGALLMLMRYRGESPEEVAGFAAAARVHAQGWAQTGAALDWPAYAAGRSRGLPWFLLSARLLARAGFPVLIHGFTANAGALSDPATQLDAAGIPAVRTPAEAAAALAEAGIAYAPLSAVSPDLLRLLKLREVLGLRSAVNTVARMLNPAGAAATVQGVFHPPYRELQQEAARLLGQPAFCALKGGGGEFERHPGKAVTLYRLADAKPLKENAPSRLAEARRLAEGPAEGLTLGALWRGEARDAFAEALVLGTAAAALLTCGAAPSLEAAEARAAALWSDRSEASARGDAA